MKPRYNPNLHDLKFVKCPLCNKDMVRGRWHACKELLQSDQYTNQTTKVIMWWKPDVGWAFYCRGQLKGYLDFPLVFNVVRNNPDWISTGKWKNPKEIKNIY